MPRIVEIAGHFAFFGAFTGIIFGLLCLGASFNGDMLEMLATLLVCILMAQVVRRDKTASRLLGFLELLLLVPLLSYDALAMVTLWLENPHVNPDTLLNVAVVDMFHGIKDYGVSSLHSLLLLLCLPLSAIVTQKIFVCSKRFSDYLTGESEVLQAQTFVSLQERVDCSQGTTSHFLRSFADGFRELSARHRQIVRYLLVSYILSFMAIFFLSYFHLPPLVPTNLREPAQAYWIFMDTVVFGFVWSLYWLRCRGKGYIEAGYLRFLLPLLVVVDFIGAAVTMALPSYVLSAAFPPRVLFGMVICMISLTGYGAILEKIHLRVKVIYFLVGAFVIVVPPTLLTYSYVASYVVWALYLWSTSAIGISIYAYLLSSLAKVKHPGLIAALALVSGLSSFTARLLTLYPYVVLPQTSLPFWLIGWLTGIAGGVIWGLNPVFSTLLLGSGWVMVEIFSHNWFSLFAFIFSCAASRSIVSGLNNLLSR